MSDVKVLTSQVEAAANHLIDIYREAAGLSVIGTLDALLTAKRAGLLKSIRPELDALVRTSFFVGPQLYDKLLAAAGEID